MSELSERSERHRECQYNSIKSSHHCHHCQLLTGRPDDAADVQNNVFRSHPLPQPSINTNQHIPCLGLRQRTRRQYVLHLRRADAKRDGAKSAVRRRVGIAAYGGGSRQREALLGTDDVDYALPLVGHPKVFEAEIGHILFQLQDLGAAGGLGDETLDGEEGGAVGGRDVVIDGDQGSVGSADGAGGEAKSLEGLRGGHLLVEWSEAKRKRKRAAAMERSRRKIMIWDEIVITAVL